MGRPRTTESGMCGAWMPKVKETCARGTGHGGGLGGGHRRASGVAAARQAQALERQKVPGKAATLFNQARIRARQKGLPFDLTREWVEGELEVAVANGCPYLGIPILLDCGHADPRCPSIDQFNPGAGYTQDNCIIVSYKANAVKRDASLAELELLTSNVARLARTRFREVDVA